MMTLQPETLSMKTAAFFGLSLGLLVSAASLSYSHHAKLDSCSHQLAIERHDLQALKNPQSADNPIAMPEQFRQIYPGPACYDVKLDTVDFANAALGGAIVGLFAYTFGLLFGKFQRWASR
jgi:hypothetical protein